MRYWTPFLDLTGVLVVSGLNPQDVVEIVAVKASDQFRTTPFNSIAATHSIESSYFQAIAPEFNKLLKLVRDQIPCSI
jgi:hypothetical protein